MMSATGTVRLHRCRPQPGRSCHHHTSHRARRTRKSPTRSSRPRLGWHPARSGSLLPPCHVLIGPQVRTEYCSQARTDANRPKVRTTAGAPPKSEKRDTAERSIIATLGLVVAMGATQFVPGDSSKQKGAVRTQHSTQHT